MGTRSSSLDEVRTAIVEPKEPIRIADGSGDIPDPLLWDRLPKMAIHKVPGCLEENCKMAFEHMAGGPDIIVKVPPSRIIDEETDADGVTLQRISAVIPNHAKPGGRVRVLSDDIEIEVFGVTPVSCNSVQRNSSYVISNTLQNRPNTPCGQTQAKAP